MADKLLPALPHSLTLQQRGKLTIPLDKRSSILTWRREKNAAILPWSEELEAYAMERTER